MIIKDGMLLVDDKRCPVIADYPDFCSGCGMGILLTERAYHYGPGVRGPEKEVYCHDCNNLNL